MKHNARGKPIAKKSLLNHFLTVWSCGGVAGIGRQFERSVGAWGLERSRYKESLIFLIKIIKRGEAKLSPFFYFNTGDNYEK